MVQIHVRVGILGPPVVSDPSGPYELGCWAKQMTDATPEVVGEADQHPTSKGSEGQAIVVMDSLEMGFHGQSASETTLSANLGETKT